MKIKLVLLSLLVAAANSFASDKSEVRLFVENAKAAIESGLNEPMDAKALQVLTEEIELGQQYLERPRPIANNGIRLILACAHGTYALGKVVAIGVSGLVCYDWQNDVAYRIGGLDGGLGRPTAVVGVGLLIADTPDLNSLEGAYVCGGIQSAGGQYGAIVHYCRDTNERIGDFIRGPKIGSQKSMVFIGYEAGVGFLVGGKRIRVSKFNWRSWRDWLPFELPF